MSIDLFPNDMVHDFDPNRRQLKLHNVVFPALPDLATGMQADVVVADANVVYSSYDKNLRSIKIEEDAKPIEVLDFIWKTEGSNTERRGLILGFINPYLERLYQVCQENELHTMAMSHSNDRIKELDVHGTVVVIRVYRDQDFRCQEHPEMMLGVPIGMYHCPQCGVMQVAGRPHVYDN